ncbi:hypothetical protein [Oxalobacter paraformigenes]|uniref:Uncharacterized protein n=1 Tax=Oxalobacter paraformigenes TaxID=556268 RepID=C3X3J8_9BURK|nr:hypothetical protein [Oxalobacter paraformigenes]EEO27784.1 hypothetical protein OFAG_00937 [Oxalobacter paraformigenes]
MIILTKFNGYRADGRRLYFKGGDGGAGEMRKMEEERQARIDAAIQAINDIFDPPATKRGVNPATSFDPSKTYYNADGSVFTGAVSGKGSGGLKVSKTLPYGITPPGAFQLPASVANAALASGGKGGGIRFEPYQTINGQKWNMGKVRSALANGRLYTGVETVQPENKRLKLYEDQRDAVYQINSKDVNRQYGDAERNNRFGLARHGLMGGSVDVDSNAQLQEKTNEGLMKASGIADSAAASLKAKDESARQNLISMAQSGIDTGTAQQMAIERLNTTAQEAEGARAGASVGDLFGNMTQAYLRYRKLNGDETALSLNGNNQGGLSTRTSYDGYTSR